MHKGANILIFTYILSKASFSSETKSEIEAYYLDPRHTIPFQHLFTVPGYSQSIALTFINDVMQADTPNPPKCDFLGFRNDSRPEEPTAKFDIVCLKMASLRPVAFIGLQTTRFERQAIEITQYELADNYARQLDGIPWEKRIRAFKTLVPILSIIVSHFEAGPIDRLVKHSKMLDTWSYDHLYEGLAVTTMYLDKCRERVRRDSDVMRDNLDKWCHLFMFASSYRVGEVPTWVRGDGPFEEAYRRLDPGKYTEEELKLHNDTLKAFEENIAMYKEAVREGRWKPSRS